MFSPGAAFLWRTAWRTKRKSVRERLEPSRKETEHEKKRKKKGAGRKILPFHYQSGPSQKFVSKMRKNKQHYVKVLLKRFHLNGHTTEIYPRTQKLELTYKTPSLTFRVKIWKEYIFSKDTEPTRSFLCVRFYLFVNIRRKLFESLAGK